MDLYIKITDENGDLRESVNVYQDGSDSEGAKEIRDWLEHTYRTDPDHAAPLKKFNVRVESVTHYSLEVEAETEEDARRIADTKAGEFGEDSVGSWDIIEVKESEDA